MNITQYKLKSPKIKGEIVFIYHNGVLFSVNFNLQQPLDTKQIEWFCLNLPYAYIEYDHAPMLLGHVMLEKVTSTPTNEKIALFCRIYEQYTSVKYIVSPKASGMIKRLDITKELLDTYFTSENVLFRSKHSIENLSKFYNQLRAEFAGAYAKAKFPGYYDAVLEKKLQGQELVEYHKHLRTKGWKCNYSPGGGVTWVQTNEKPNTSHTTQSKAIDQA